MQLSHTLTAVLDIRSIAPEEQDPLLLKTYDMLQVGQSFLVVSDHDPRPLYRELLHHRSGQFRWAYLECGPYVWQITITKVHLTVREGA